MALAPVTLDSGALIRETLAELSALDATRVPEPEDAARVSDRVNATMAELTALEIIYIVDADDIDPKVFNALVAYLVEVCAPQFGRPRDKVAQGAAEQTLRTLARIGGGTGRKLTVDRALRGCAWRR